MTARRRFPSRPWAGRLLVWHGRALYVGPVFDTAAHAHHAHQVSIALDGEFRLRSGPGARWRSSRATVIAADRAHQIDGRGLTMALMYLDPESSAGRRLGRSAPPDGVRLVPERIRSSVVAGLGGCLDAAGEHAAIARICDQLVASLVNDVRPLRVDSRITKALADLAAIREHPPSLADLARQAGLSPSRFSHLFRAQTGMSLRRYRLWLRVQDAVRAAGETESLTALAHATGFADSAHLSRTFRYMFGLAPRHLIGQRALEVWVESR